VSMHVKVGFAVSPYTTDYDAPNDALGNNLQTFTHTFNPSQNDPNAGLAFTLASGTGGTVCIDNVSLTAN